MRLGELMNDHIERKPSKHKECEDLGGCVLKEHKGYDTCERQGECNLAAFACEAFILSLNVRADDGGEKNG